MLLFKLCGCEMSCDLVNMPPEGRDPPRECCEATKRPRNQRERGGDRVEQKDRQFERRVDEYELRDVNWNAYTERWTKRLKRKKLDLPKDNTNPRCDRSSVAMTSVFEKFQFSETIFKVYPNVVFVFYLQHES